jgi:hypothetical protein
MIPADELSRLAAFRDRFANHLDPVVKTATSGCCTRCFFMEAGGRGGVLSHHTVTTIVNQALTKVQPVTNVVTNSSRCQVVLICFDSLFFCCCAFPASRPSRKSLPSQAATDPLNNYWLPRAFTHGEGASRFSRLCGNLTAFLIASPPDRTAWCNS